jgi:hypothetical protein
VGGVRAARSHQLLDVLQQSAALATPAGERALVAAALLHL